MPIQPFLPIAWLNSGERVFQLAKRSSVLKLGNVSLRKARTSTRRASASGGRWNGGNSSLGMDIVVSAAGWFFFVWLFLAAPTPSFLAPNSPPPPPPPPP